MAEQLSAGVFIEEVPSQVQVIQAVSTSNLGIVGFTAMGPSNAATLVTSFNNFLTVFGGFVSESFLPLSVAAFFANGGQRCYVVRVTPSNAVAASADIQSQITNQQIEIGDGTTVTFAATGSNTPLEVAAGAAPLLAGTISFRWRGAASAPTALQDLRNRGNTAAVGQVTSQAAYEARINPTSLAGAYSGGVLLDSNLYAVVPGTAELSWNPDGVAPRTISIPVNGSAPFQVTTTAPNNQGSVVTLDHITGFVSILFAGTDVPAGGATGNIQMTFTAAIATQTIVDSSGELTGASLTAPGSITYSSGAFTFTTSALDKPHNKSPILATYKVDAWALAPVSAGEWGNDLQIQIAGDLDFENIATASFSRFNVNILLLNETTNVYSIQETYDGLSFTDPTDSLYFADVLNDLSSLVTVAEPGGNQAPGQLAGVPYTQVIAGGDDLSANQTIAATLINTPVAPRSVIITYFNASGGVLETITDDGNGNLTGSVDTTGANTITYTSGAISVKTLDLIAGATLVTVTYYTSPVETSHTENFGDTTKDYTVGTDGTFDSTHYSRSQFTAPGALQSSYAGLYALDRVDDIMQVAIPDFAGDPVVTGDLLDYADAHAAAPSGGDRFIILTVPQGSNAQQAVSWFRYTLGRFSNFAALYWPWVVVANPLANNRPLTIPALGHVAGIYARTDATKNVGKSPGGTVDGALNFLTGLEVATTQGDRDTVYPNKINPLISGPQTGLAVWGVRTISSTSDWMYINARRLFMFLEKSIFNATAWIVFENNGPSLWGRIKAQLTGFLNALYIDGYFAGTTPAQAFFVICDNTNNTPDTIDAGQVIIDVGIAPNKPAEFVVFRFQQIALS